MFPNKEAKSGHDGRAVLPGAHGVTGSTAASCICISAPRAEMARCDAAMTEFADFNSCVCLQMDRTLNRNSGNCSDLSEKSEKYIG